MKRKEEAFTLIELLVVVAIIGVLASTVLAATGIAKQRGRDARRQSDLKNIKTALLLYNENTGGNFPLQTVLTPEAADTTSALNVLVTSGFVPSVPADPSAGKSYYYVSNSTGTKFCLAAELERIDSQDFCDATVTTDIDAISTAHAYRFGSE